MYTFSFHSSNVVVRSRDTISAEIRIDRLLQLLFLKPPSHLSKINLYFIADEWTGVCLVSLFRLSWSNKPNFNFSDSLFTMILLKCWDVNFRDENYTDLGYFRF